MVQHKVYLKPPFPLPELGYNDLDISVQEGRYQDKCRLASSKDYWALERVDAWQDDKLQKSLDGRGIVYNPGTRQLRHESGKAWWQQEKSQARLQQEKLHHRAERGLLIYENVALSQLRKFASSRRLEPNVNHARKSKAYLVALLEKADEEATFPQFEVMAAELRNMVYDHYLTALDTDTAHVPLLPPLVKVSRQIRIESLPRLYDIFTIHHGWYNREVLFGMKLANQREHIASIRHVQFSWPTDCSEVKPGRSYHTINVRIDMQKDGQIPSLRWTFLDPSGKETDPPAFKPINPVKTSGYGRMPNFKIQLEKLHQDLVDRATFAHSKDEANSEDGGAFQKGLGLRWEDIPKISRILADVYRPW